MHVCNIHVVYTHVCVSVSVYERYAILRHPTHIELVSIEEHRAVVLTRLHK